MDEVINRENFSRLLGPAKSYLYSKTYDFVPVTEECKVDTDEGIRTAHEGDFIKVSDSGGSHLEILSLNEMEVKYIPIPNEDADNEPSLDKA